jgi:small subunit ribosomal protein S10e
MLMPKKNRRAIYEYLFKEGVMVAEKDFHKPVHPDLEGIPNLQVIKAMQVFELLLFHFSTIFINIIIF